MEKSDENPRKPIRDEAISVVLLALNGDAVAATRAWTAHLDGGKRAYEVLVVTRQPVPEELGGLASDKVKVLSKAQLAGTGAALRVGIKAAQHPLLLYTAPDYAPADLETLLKEIDQVDLVSGFRAVQPAP